MHVFKRVSCSFPRLDDPPDEVAGVEIFVRMLRDFVRTSHCLSIHNHGRQRESIRTGYCKSSTVVSLTDLTKAMQTQIWCWITLEWSFLRVATLYGIVWLALIAALVIYCIALTKAWRHRHALVGLLNPLNENPFGGIITTEIEVVVSTANGRESVTYGDHVVFGSVFDGPRSLDRKNENAPYTVNVQGARSTDMHNERSRPELLRIPSMTRNAALAAENCEAWLYARVAFLYFVVMIICWTPASINRLVSVIDPDQVIFGLNFAAVIFLPLQGFLNALVYCVSSQTGVRNLFRHSMRGHVKPKDAERIRDSYPGYDAFVFEDRGSHSFTNPGFKANGTASCVEGLPR